MKKNKLVGIFFVSIFIIGAMMIFPGISLAGQENLILDSDDATQVSWKKYGYAVGDIVDNGDGSQTFAQSIDSVAYMRQALATNPCVNYGEDYVIRGKMEASVGEYVTPKMYLGLGGAPSIALYKNDNLEWSSFTMQFAMDVNTYLQINGLATASTFSWRDLQIVRDPGPTLFSVGDSITQNSWTGTYWRTDVYTDMYEYDKDIVAINAGDSGKPLIDNKDRVDTDIYENMQAYLEGDTEYPVMFIEGGINDLVQDDDDVATMESEMTTILDYAQSKTPDNGLIVVFGLPPVATSSYWDDINEFNTWLETEASNRGIQYFDMLDVLGLDTELTPGTTKNDLNPDYYVGTNIHPTPVGHRALTDALMSQVTLPNTSLYISDNITTGGTCVRDESAPSITLNFPTGNLPDGTTETTLSLTTDEESICRYSTSSGVDYDSMTETFEETGETAHSQLVTGLVNGNTYNYYVKCRDRATNENAEDLEINFSVTGEVTNNAPTDISLSNNSIDENQPSFTTIGTLSTTDADSGDSHTYSLNCSTPGVDDSYFNISGEELRNTEVFDYETPIDDNSDNNYEICVRTNDGTDTLDENFTVTVNDTSDTLGENIAVGFQALLSNLSNGNIGIGNFSGQYVGIAGIDSNILGNSSIFIGENTRPLADDETNQIVIGTDAIGLGSDSVVLGNDDIATTALKGNVGIGINNPSVELDVDGLIRAVPTDARVCDGGTKGGIFFNSNDDHFYGCNGAEWVQLDN